MAFDLPLGVGERAPASVGELLEGAQRRAWDLAVSLPSLLGSPHRQDRVRMAAGQVREQLVAWPALAAAAAHALASVPLGPQDDATMAPLVTAVAQLGAAHVPVAVGDAVPSGELRRITALLGAAGDLMADTPWSLDTDGWRDAAAVRDKIAVVMRTAATTTLSCIEMAPGTTKVGGVWDTELRHLVDAAREVTVTPAADRAGRYDDLAANATANVSAHVLADVSGGVSAGGDGRGRYAVLAVWEAASRRALTDRFVTSDDLHVAAGDIAMVAQAAALTLRTAGRVGLIDSVTAQLADTAAQRSASTMNRFHEALTGVSTGLGRDREHYEASREMRKTLLSLFQTSDRPDQVGTSTSLGVRGDLAQLVADMRLLLARSEGLAASVAAATTTVAARGGFLVPARVALASSVRPAPLEWLVPAARGGWVSAPATLPQVQRVVDAAGQAHGDAKLASAAAVPTSRTFRPRPGAPGWAAGAQRSPAPYRAGDRYPGGAHDGGPHRGP